jgi:subtilisin-like proprotein convertase family protein
MKSLKLLSSTSTSPVFTLIFLAGFLVLPATNTNGQNLSTSRTLPLDAQKIAADLTAAPLEFSANAESKPLLFDLPMPEGGEQTFKVVASPMMSPDFQLAYPFIKTYGVQSISDPSVQGRLTTTPNGFFAAILTKRGMALIRPLNLNNPVMHEASYDEAALTGIDCHVEELEQGFQSSGSDFKNAISNGATRRTYDLAIVTTGEFYAANGGSGAAATAVVTATMNAIQAIYDRELAIRFILLTPFHYTDPATDPFNPGLNRTLEAAQAVNANFPGGNYDIGHVFHDQDQAPAELPGGGVAGLGVVCSNNAQGTGFRKAAGWSGSFNNVDNGWIRLATHEFGHMFNMNHTFNGNGDNCNGGNLSLNTAYEIASGTTIMSYNGICGAGQNIPGGSVSDNYFHANSLTDAATYISGQNCHTAAATGNAPPVVNANPCGGAFTIPVSTPFTLTGSGTDANGEAIYYCWEQYDEDGAGVSPTHGFIGATAAGSTIAPLFRSYPPTTSPTRTFPNMNLVVNNSYASDFEPLPTVARTLNFRLFGRDFNNNGGGIHCQSLAVTVSSQGPLTLTAPNGGGTLTAGNTTTVTWNLNGISFLTNVRIKLSIDGGFTYPYTLIASTPAADGTETVTIPSGVPNTTTARMMVESADNACVTFFDISNSNFSITSNCTAIQTEVSPVTPVSFPVGDPGLNLGMTNNLGSIVANFSGTVTTSDPAGVTVFLDNTPPVCATTNSGNYDTYLFSPDVSGSYTFTHTGPFGLVLNLYSTPFTGTNCSNHLASSATRPSGSGAISLSSSVTATLTANATYVLTVSSFSSSFPTLPAAYTINFTKPGGSNIYNGIILPAGYAYTYVAVNTGNGQVSVVSSTSNFTSLTAGPYCIYGAMYKSSGATPPPLVNPANWVGQTLSVILSGGDCVAFSTNCRLVTVTGGCTAPVINAPTVTQPTCAVNGTIVVNATGSSTLEYSVNGGASWQTASTFSNLQPGNYNIQVRLQSNPACVATYASNPVVLNSPATVYTSTDVPKTISGGAPPITVTSTLNIPASGTITDVNVLNLDIDHTWINDLRVKLKSPANTERFLFDQICNDQDNILINFDDESPNNHASIPCPPNGGTYQPNQTLGAFDGQNLNGLWTLTIEDLVNGDGGSLQAWSLEVCYTPSGCTPPVVNAPTVTQPTCATPTGTIVVNATGSGALEYSVDNGSNWQTSSSFPNLAPGNYNIKVRLQSNPTCMTTYASNPVVINAVPTAPAVNAPTVTQPTCATPTGTIVVNATGSGALEYSVDNGSNWQTSSSFPNLAPGNYNIKVRLQSNPTCMTTYASNPVVINAVPTAPAVNAPTVTQPTCATPTGTIVVNATGSGALEYSVDNGSNWQTSSSFPNLPPGNYNIRARLQANPTCNTAYASNPVVINAVPSAPVVNAPTVTQPTCATPTGTIVVNATGSGALEYSVDNGSNWQTSASFPNLAPGNYNIKVGIQFNPTCTTAYASNPVVINAVPTAPVVNAPTVTQPTCATPTGTIVVNATGSGTLEYSVNTGTNWQTSATFSNLPPGNYNIMVRLQSDITCLTSYAMNPVVLNTPLGCCNLPTYTNECTSDDIIEDFTFGTFSNLATGCGNPGPSNYTNFIPNGPNVQIGETYTVTIKAGSFQQYYGVYIDFNGNGDYTEAGEFFNIGLALANSTVNGNITIPSTATVSTRTIRVRSSFDGPLTAADGCNTNLAWGEIEDYSIYIFCPNNLAVNSDPIPSGTYNAQAVLTSTGKVANGSNVIFQSGGSVDLQALFEVELGGVFEIMIQGCFP